MAIAVTQYPADRSRLASLWIRCYHVYKDITKATVDKHLNHVTKRRHGYSSVDERIYADTLSMKDLTARQLELQSCKSAEVLCVTGWTSLYNCLELVKLQTMYNICLFVTVAR